LYVNGSFIHSSSSTTLIQTKPARASRSIGVVFKTIWRLYLGKYVAKNCRWEIGIVLTCGKVLR
jgi:hypothetical protein